ncbi:putative DNA binding domain-containing protein, partial [Candidatus Woesearchaeota archaeon]|nr:putative DNA binding domain-containing protein [Candidatus Woesearchaeota archaeon]
ELIKNGENQEVEFKEGCPKNCEISETICAFANTDGGYFILGVSKKGEIKGLTCNLDSLQQNIANANQAVQSLPIISTSIFDIDSRKIALIRVSMANDKNAHTFKGVVYIRIGSTNRRLEGQSLFDFLKNKQILCFDEQDSEAKFGDLDENKVKLYLAKRGQEDYLKINSLKDFIISNMLGKSNGDIKLKNVASLFFSQNPIKWHPQSEVRVVRFDGIKPIKVISQKDFVSNPFENIEQTMAFVRQNISKRFIIPEGSATRIEVEEYPIEAIREAVVNAIAHRDYYSYDSIQINLFDDRIEMSNPGGLPEGLPKEFFGKRSVRRNPITYRLLRDCHYVEGLGTGIPKMINEMRKSGLKDPEFSFEGGFFVVTLRNIKSTIKPRRGMRDLSQRQLNAMGYLRQNKTIKSKTYANINNVSLPIALKDIAELIKFKYLKKVGSYRGAYYTLKEEQK